VARGDGAPQASGGSGAERPPRLKKVLSVNEIFYSIQGESTYAGKPCVFVRLAGCDLRCTWCDTAYAFNEGQKMSIEEVLQRVDRYGSPLVEVTGGEPLLQDDVYPLMERLLDSGRTVLLETGGQIDVSRVPGGVVKVLDVKCPASGESDKVEWGNIDRLGSRDQVKFVIQNRADYEFARDIVRRHALDRRCAAVLFSPVHGVMNPKDLSEWILEDRMPVRLQLQIHKHIWGANVRGV
jgi:7-carboxy-7-deazaguanine synthase